MLVDGKQQMKQIIEQNQEKCIYAGHKQMNINEGACKN